MLLPILYTQYLKERHMALSGQPIQNVYCVGCNLRSKDQVHQSTEQQKQFPAFMVTGWVGNVSDTSTEQCSV